MASARRLAWGGVVAEQARDEVAGLQQRPLRLRGRDVFAGAREVQQEPRRDTGQAGAAVHPPRGHEPSFAIAELDCFAGERERACVPVALEEQLDGPEGVEGNPVPRMEFSVPVVLADLAGPAGDQEDVEVLLLRRADVTRGAPDVLGGGSDLGDQQAADPVRADRALEGACPHLGDGHRAEARHRVPPERFSFGWAHPVGGQGLRHDLPGMPGARAGPGGGGVPAVPPPGPVERGRRRLPAAAGGWLT